MIVGFSITLCDNNHHVACFRAVARLFAACLLLEANKQKNRDYVTVQLSFYPLYTCRVAGKRLTVSWDSWLIHSLFPIFFLAHPRSLPYLLLDHYLQFWFTSAWHWLFGSLIRTTGEQTRWIIVFVYLCYYNKLPVTALHCWDRAACRRSDNREVQIIEVGL